MKCAECAREFDWRPVMQLVQGVDRITTLYFCTSTCWNKWLNKNYE